jgi:hypothetical protein
MCATPLVDVGEVEPDCLLADAHLLRARVGNVHFSNFKDFRPTVTVDQYCGAFDGGHG